MSDFDPWPTPDRASVDTKWTTHDGRQILIRQLDFNHLQNIFYFVTTPYLNLVKTGREIAREYEYRIWEITHQPLVSEPPPNREDYTKGLTNSALRKAVKEIPYDRFTTSNATRANNLIYEYRRRKYQAGLLRFVGNPANPVATTKSQARSVESYEYSDAIRYSLLELD